MLLLLLLVLLLLLLLLLQQLLYQLLLLLLSLQLLLLLSLHHDAWHGGAESKSRCTELVRESALDAAKANFEPKWRRKYAQQPRG